MKRFLRKHRKWPISESKSQCQKKLDQTLALQTLKQHQTPQTLLATLVDSFHSRGCDATAEAYSFVVETLIETSRFESLAQVLERIESVEKFETPERFFPPIIAFMGLEGRFGDAVDLFYRIPNFRCVPSLHSLNSLLCVLCERAEGFGFVPEVLIKSKSMNIRLEESSFWILIGALCRIGKVGNAIEVLNCMISDGYGLDQRFCSLILSSVCRQKDELGLDGLKVLGFLEKMERFSFRPRIVDYSKVIRVLVKERNSVGALKVLGQIKANGTKPDIFCYTMILDGLVSAKEYKNAEKLFDELLVLGLVPNLHTYNAYINCLCEKKEFERAVNTISYMEELGCKPNLITYNHILKALCENGEVDHANELVTEMNGKGIETSSLTYEILLGGEFVRGDIVKACVLMEEMLDKCLYSRCSSYDEIIIGLCKRGLVCEAVEMSEKMALKNVALGPRAWESLILSFVSEFQLPKALWTDLVNAVETLPDNKPGNKLEPVSVSPKI